MIVIKYEKIVAEVIYMSTQRQDFQWFKENYEELSRRYGASYVAIKNQQILGVYRTYADGVRETSKAEPKGTFIIQHCNGDESGYTGYIASTHFM